MLSTAPLFYILMMGDGSSQELFFVMVSVVVLGIQGFLAELLGIRIDENGVSFPRRMLLSSPFPILWRRTIPTSEISRIDPWDETSLRLSLRSAEVVDLVFPDRESRRRFMRRSS